VITVGEGGQYPDPLAAVESIDDATGLRPCVVLLLPGTYELGDAALYLNGGGSSDGLKDFISLVGVDRDSCIVSRSISDDVLNPVIQAGNHCRIANLTITSTVSRLIHWDTSPGSRLTIEQCWFPRGGGGTGVSTGIREGSRLRVVGCEFGIAACGIHSGGTARKPGDEANPAIFEFIGNVMTAGSTLGIDTTPGGCDLHVSLSGNAMQGYAEGIRVDVGPSEIQQLVIYTDQVSGGSFANPSHAAHFWNRILFPQTAFADPVSDGLSPGALATARPGSVVGRFNVGTTNVHADLYPVVIVDQVAALSIAPPRVATGAYAEVLLVAEAAVAINDAIVTSTTPGYGTVDNTQTDSRRILGHALTPKSPGSPGRVTVKLTPTNRW
jgi:hypothetical protein